MTVSQRIETRGCTMRCFLLALAAVHARAFKHEVVANTMRPLSRQWASTLPNNNNDLLSSLTPATDKLRALPQVPPLSFASENGASILASPLSLDGSSGGGDDSGGSADDAVAVEATVGPPSLKALLAFTLGALPIYVSPCLLTVIDTGFVGRSSSLELAALGPACAIWYAN